VLGRTIDLPGVKLGSSIQERRAEVSSTPYTSGRGEGGEDNMQKMEKKDRAALGTSCSNYIVRCVRPIAA